MPDASSQRSSDAGVAAPQAQGDGVRGAVLTWLRPSRKQLVWAMALCVVAAAIVVQVRSSNEGDRYAGLRRDDLVQLLDGLTTETDQLTAEVAELERTRDALRSGADAQEVAAAEAQRRADTLGILAGTVAATGPGVRITISAPPGALTTDVMLEAIQELRDAGAEAMEINDSIRLVAQSWVGETGEGLVSDGRQISLPIVIDAIGDPHALAEGARFRGGLVSQVESSRIGGSVAIEELDDVEVTSLVDPSAPEFAEPA